MASDFLPLEGTLAVPPSLTRFPLEFVADEYAALADEYGPKNVLVVKRHPAGLERVRETIANAAAQSATPRSPRVESLPEHASKLIEEYDPTLDRLEYEERIELISLVIDGASRDVPPYLERARNHESFARDVGQLLLEATRQQIRLAEGETDADALDDRLEFLYAMNDRFHEELEERDYIERADVIPQAVELLEADRDGLRSRITSSFDAVLAVEFEEFRRLDRRYLAALSTDARLICLGERHTSTERIRVEPGSVEDIAPGLEIEGRTADRPKSGSEPPHRSIARFLGTGQTSDATNIEGNMNADREGDTTEGESETRAGALTNIPGRIRAHTAREQIDAVATEIQSLCDRRDELGYDDIAVALPHVERVPATRHRLRAASIPTATIGVPSLSEDPAVNELYAYVVCQRERTNPASDTDQSEDTGYNSVEQATTNNVARERLAARVEEFSPKILTECADASLSTSLARWIVHTDLKGRISRQEEWIDAREQFEGIRRVLEIARFVEETDLVGPDWQGFARMLERTIRYDAPHVHAVETRTPTGGVTVCSVDELAYDPHAVVFLLDLTEENYPGESSLTQLFPTAWVREMPHYPAVTDPMPKDLERTFAPIVDGESVADRFETYHAQRARRRLAIGARAATDRLYCCSYERESDGLRRTHEASRYLKLLERVPNCSFEDIDVSDREAKIYGETNALETLLGEPRGELERIVREASTGGDADLSETEALFEEIAVVLEDEAVDDELVNAVLAQFEFAAGEVSRRE